MEIGLPEAINLTVTEWSHIQELDYEQIPFKCRFFHGYGHFARNCKKKAEEEIENEKDDQWTQVQKAGNTNQGPRKKGKEGKIVKGDSAIGKNPPFPQVDNIPISPSNHFVVLSSSETLEEG